MSEDWKPGDLALCVRGGKIDNAPFSVPDYPRSGAFYEVEDCRVFAFWDRDSVALYLKDGPVNVCGLSVWNAVRFIKVTPPEADEYDRETIGLMDGVPA